MSTFTLTGQLETHSHLPWVDAHLEIVGTTYPDPVADIIYIGSTSVVLDADGQFSVDLESNASIVYYVQSGDPREIIRDPLTQSPLYVGVPSQTAGSTHDLSEFYSSAAVSVTPSVLAEAIAARDAAVAAAASVAASTWQASTAYVAGQVVQAPDGSRIKSNTSRTSRPSFDATEQGNWTVVAGKSGTLEQVEFGRTAGFSVVAFGAKGDGTNDDTSAIAAAVAALPSSGGVVLFPPGTYKVTSTIDIGNKTGVKLVGPGGGQRSALGSGAATIVYSGTGYAVQWATAAGSALFGGFVVEGLHIRGSGTTPDGGLWLGNGSNARLRGVTLSDFRNGTTTGTGLKVGTATSTGSQYHEAQGCTISFCDIGIDLLESNGFRFIGGFLEDQVPTPRAGTVAVKCRSGADTAIFIGTVAQGWETLFDMAGGFSQVIGCRCEGFTTAIKLSGTKQQVIGGSINNSSNGSTGTAIQVVSGAANCYVNVAGVSSVSKTLDDAGTATAVVLPGLRTTVARKTKGGTNVAINSATYVAVDSATLDITLTNVMVGEWIEVGLSCRVNNEAVGLDLDAQTIVASTPVNSVGQQNGSTPIPTSGPALWSCPASAFMNPGGSLMYQLTAGDIDTGNVLIRLMAKGSTSSTKTILISNNNPVVFWARNHGRG